jgi:hypothetical protein
LLFEPTVTGICKGRSARAHLGHLSLISRSTHPMPFFIAVGLLFFGRDYACNKFAKPLVNRYGRAWERVSSHLVLDPVTRISVQ